MSAYRQIKTLILQELKQALRSRYIIFSFLVVPLIMWGLQGGLQFVANESADSNEETFHIINFDNGNETHNLGKIVADQLKKFTATEGAILFNAIALEDDLGNDYSSVLKKVEIDGISPIVIIHTNFTDSYTKFNTEITPFPAVIELIVLPTDTLFSSKVEHSLKQILSSDPFTIYSFEKLSYVSTTQILYEGEEGAAKPIGEGIGFIAFISILLAVMAPATFVSASFAGEREKKTLEALLVLPMNRMHILLSKTIAGMGLISLFVIMNFIGMIGYSHIVEDGIILTMYEMIAISGVLFLTSFVAIGFGIAIASFAKDQKTANSGYQLIMLLPVMITTITALFEGISDKLDVMYLIPWNHSIALLYKVVYPKTYSNQTLTDFIGLDIFLHIMYLILFVILNMIIASKLFEREKILG